MTFGLSFCVGFVLAFGAIGIIYGCYQVSTSRKGTGISIIIAVSAVMNMFSLMMHLAILSLVGK